MATLSDGELFKKTLRTTLVMLGTTAVWLGVLTSAIVFSTSPAASAGGESKVEKGAGSAAGSPAIGAAHGPGIVPSPRSIHPSKIPLRPDSPHPGDQI